MKFPLYVLFILYVVFLGIFFIFSLFHVYHLYRFAPRKKRVGMLIFVYFLLSFFIIGITLLFLSDIEWTKSYELIPPPYELPENI